MQNKNLTNKENEYLAILYEFLENGLNRVTISELASKSYVTLGAVSSIFKKLRHKQYDADNLINYMKGYGVALTQIGQKVAGKIVRRRRIGEIFLKHLGFDFYTIQKQIQQNNFSDVVSDKIEEEFFQIDSDNRCSHGYLVPDKNGTYEFEQLKTLNQFDSNSKVKIVKIPESPFCITSEYNPVQTNLFMHIFNNNLVPRQSVEVLSKDPNFLIIETDSGESQIPIGSLANQIFVIKAD